MYNKHWDIIMIHWIKYKVYMVWDRCFLNNSSWSNDEIFDKLWIKDKYAFCNIERSEWSFPVHNSIESLNITIQKLLNYWVTDNTFYKSLMYDDI